MAKVWVAKQYAASIRVFSSALTDSQQYVLDRQIYRHVLREFEGSSQTGDDLGSESKTTTDVGRVFGFVPTYGITNNKNAPALATGASSEITVAPGRLTVARTYVLL